MWRVIYIIFWYVVVFGIEVCVLLENIQMCLVCLVSSDVSMVVY
jgi:hypothetical protein